MRKRDERDGKGEGGVLMEGKEKMEVGLGVYGHRNWSVSRYRAQCAVVKSDCPEKKLRLVI